MMPAGSQSPHYTRQANVATIESNPPADSPAVAFADSFADSFVIERAIIGKCSRGI
jgi:hypothetical protein